MKVKEIKEIQEITKDKIMKVVIQTKKIKEMKVIIIKKMEIIMVKITQEVQLIITTLIIQIIIPMNRQIMDQKNNSKATKTNKIHQDSNPSIMEEYLT